MQEQDININNYITINRRLFKHPFWEEKRPFSRFEAWLDLCQSARFEITEARRLIDGKLVVWYRGELPASLRFLAERWQWSKNKVDHYLKLLESEKMIKKRTAQGTSQTVITLCNYDSYNHRAKKEGQPNGQLRDSEGTGEGQTRDKTNKENIENKENSIEANASAGEPERDLFKEFSLLVQDLNTDTKADLIAAKKAVFEFIQANSPEFIEPYVYQWNIYAKQNDCPKVQHITDYRKKKFKTRIKEEQFNFIEILTKAKDSEFLNSSTFFSFDWILENQENYTKILEGNYDNKSKAQSHANNQQSTQASNGKNGNHGKSAGAIKLAHSLAADLGYNDQ